MVCDPSADGARGRVHRLTLALALVATAAQASFLPPPAESPVYAQAVTAGGDLKVDKDTAITGDVHANGDVELKKDTTVDGAVSAVGSVDTRGTITGTITEGAAPVALPFPLDEAALRAGADRILDGDQTFRDQVIDDVVFVDGDVTIEDTVDGVGTVIARGKLKVKKGSGGQPPATQMLALIAFDDLDVDKDRALRGALVAADKIKIDKDTVFEGTIVAGGKVEIKKGCQITFLAADDTAPTIELLSPAPGSVTADPQPTITAAWSDSGSGVDPATAIIELDGVDLTAAAAIDAAGATLVPPDPLGEGVHSVRLAVADLEGNAAEATFLFGVGAVAPLSLAINRPAAGPSFDPGTLTVAAGFDSGFGIVPGSLRLTLDGADVDLGGCDLGADYLRCTLPSPGAGAHAVAAEIADLAGVTASDQVDFSLVVDDALPTIAIVTPSQPLLLGEPAPVVEVVYADADAGIDTETFVLRLDGADIASLCAIAADGAFCQLQPLPPGPHLLDAAISDTTGNLAQTSFGFEQGDDALPPAIEIASPEDGVVVNTAFITVAGTVSDANGVVEVLVDGAAATFDGSAFEADVGLVPGLNAILVEAVDGAANREIASVRVELVEDLDGPALAIAAPVAGSFVAEDRPEIIVDFDDPSGIDEATLTFVVGGAPLPASCKVDAFRARCTPEASLAAGAVTLDAVLADFFGNTTVRSVTFTHDPEPVVVVIDQPVDASIITADTVTVSGTAGPEAVAVDVNGVAATLTGNAFEATVPVREGTAVVVAQATKSNGNSGAGSVEVTRDVQAPIVRIEHPADGAFTAAGSVDVSGLVNDVVEGGVEPTVTVNGLPAEVAIGTFLVTGVPLAAGANVIEAVATDAAGNQTHHQVTVTFAPPPLGPRLELAGGNGQLGVVGGALAEPLEVVVRDGLGVPLPGKVVRFRVSRNSAALRRAAGEPAARLLSVGTDGSGRAAALVTLGDTPGAGNNRVTATAIGVPGEVTFHASALAGAPDRILMTFGDNQIGTIGRPVPQHLEALVVDSRGNPVPGVPVTFEVIEGGGSIDGADTALRLSDPDGLVRAAWTLGPSPGRTNNQVLASFPDLPGLAASFVASSLAPGDPAATSFSGVVLDNAQVPIPGALVAIDHDHTAITDDQGRFLITGVPAGHVHLTVDPAGSPRPEHFPPLAFETVLVAGNANDLGQPILLPFIDDSSTQIVGGAQDVTLSMPGVDGLTLTVFAGSATFPDGSTEGALSVSQVQLDKVPMPPPNGSFFMPPAWTLQPAGVVFDPPARLTIANDGLAAGRQIDIFQFDHHINRFLNVGRGTVDEDGAIITSDPGFGITRTGWGGCGQPPPPQTCGKSCDDDNRCTNDRCIGSHCRHIALDGPSCDDGKLCTEPDKCSNGHCGGDKIKDREGLSIQRTIDLGAAFQGLKNTWKRLGSTTDLNFKYNVNGGYTVVCCEAKNDKEIRNPKVTIGGTIALTTPDVPIPGISIPLPFGLPRAGVFFAGSVAVSGNGTVQFDRCAGGGKGSVTVDGNLSGTLKAQVEIPGNITKLAVGGTTGVAAIWSSTASGDSLTGPFTAAWTGVVVSGTVELLNGLIEFTGNIVAIQPTDLGSGVVTVPLNL